MQKYSLLNLEIHQTDTFVNNESRYSIGKRQHRRSSFVLGDGAKELKMTKTGNHAAFSMIRLAPGTSLPGAPNKSMHQLPKSVKICSLRTVSSASV
jgi:hypothetical protein